MHGLEKQSEKQCCLPADRNRRILAGMNYTSCCGFNHLDLEQDKLPGYFCFVCGSEKANLEVYLDSHNYVFYHHSWRRVLADVLQIETVSIPFL